MTLGKPGIMLPLIYTIPIDRLPDEAAGCLLRSLLQYGKNGDVRSVPPAAYALWSILLFELEQGDELYYSRYYEPRRQKEEEEEPL